MFAASEVGRLLCIFNWSEKWPQQADVRWRGAANHPAGGRQIVLLVSSSSFHEEQLTIMEIRLNIHDRLQWVGLRMLLIATGVIVLYSSFLKKHRSELLCEILLELSCFHKSVRLCPCSLASIF